MFQIPDVSRFSRQVVMHPGPNLPIVTVHGLILPTTVTFCTSTVSGGDLVGGGSWSHFLAVGVQCAWTPTGCAW